MKICKICNKNLPLSLYFKNSHMADSHLNTCKQCFKDNRNPESSRLASKKYRKNNPNKISDYNSKYRVDNKDILLERMKEWHKLNSYLSTFHKAKRRASKRQATPYWSDLELIKEIYKAARELTVITGIQFHVDHIIPLTNKLVCGLHTPSNLQILPYYENLSKHNKLIEDIV